MPELEEATRGSVLVGLVSFLESNCDAPTYARVRDSFSPELKSDLANVKHAVWYPRAHFIELNRAIANLHADSDEEAAEALTEAGRHICEIASNSFMKLLLRMLTPKMFSQKFPDFWDRDNRGGACRVDTSELDQNRMVAWIEDVKGFDHVGPVARGYVGFAMERITGKPVKITMEGWSLENPSEESIRLQCEW